jgi:hypothetical protein
MVARMGRGHIHRIGLPLLTSPIGQLPELEVFQFHYIFRPREILQALFSGKQVSHSSVVSFDSSSDYVIETEEAFSLQ